MPFFGFLTDFLYCVHFSLFIYLNSILAVFSMLDPFEMFRGNGHFLLHLFGPTLCSCAICFANIWNTKTIMRQSTLLIPSFQASFFPPLAIHF